jgi:exosome complex exonuclease RRP6
MALAEVDTLIHNLEDVILKPVFGPFVPWHRRRGESSGLPLDGDFTAPHPWVHRVRALQVAEAWLTCDVHFSELGDSSFAWIADRESFDRMLTDLENSRVIGVDVEHSVAGSYLGQICLIQISTDRQATYVCDALTVGDQFQRLRRCFIDPRILKIFHGAGSDLLWLQRDCGIFVVNLFDTGYGLL